MSGYLLDTNVLSEIRKGDRADVRVMSWFEKVGAEDLYLSVMTLGEIRYGVESKQRKDPQQARVLERWLERTGLHFSDRILPVSAAIADRWGRMGIDEPVPDVDAILAATAIEHGLTLVTRNVRNFSRSGVSLLNPWE
jgi:toxin FitB